MCIRDSREDDLLDVAREEVGDASEKRRAEQVDDGDESEDWSEQRESAQISCGRQRIEPEDEEKGGYE